MAFEKHLYLTATGGYTDADLQAEIWQVGVRLALVFGTIDSIGTFPSNWEPTANPHTDTGTDWAGETNWVASHMTGDFDPLDFLSQEALTAFTTWVGQAGIQSSLYLRELKLYPIGTDGNAVPAPPYAVGSPALLSITGTARHGGGSGTLLPLQSALVASHRTQQLGRKGRGRMYIPGLPVGVLQSGDDPRISSAAATAYANAQKALLLALTASGTPGPTPWAVQPVVTGAPYQNYAVINKVRVGNIVDTQRRRRNSLPEVYTDVSL